MTEDIEIETNLINVPIKQLKSSSRKNVLSPKKRDSKNIIIDLIEPNEMFEIKQATICMIDICQFSKWCMNRLPHQIVNTMKKYNAFINHHVKCFEEITKIELVGDCCMIAAGLTETMDRELCTISVVKFAVSLLQNIKTIQTIFNDDNIGIRIGIHISDVFGIVFEEPRRFQLYGNDINVCSRLESSTLKNTIRISLKTILSNEKIIVENDDLYVSSNLEDREYKGVGHISTYVLHIKKNEILWFDNTMCSIRKMINEMNDYDNTYVIKDITKLFQIMRSFYWKEVIIHCPLQSVLDKVMLEIILFREWEGNRTEQRITIITNKHIEAYWFDMVNFVNSFDMIK